MIQIIAILTLIASQSFAQDISLKVELSPAGSFTAKSSKARGKVNYKKSEKRIWSSRISVPIESFDTGINLRNEHFNKHLQFKKFPNATIKKVKGSNGKGKARLEIAGVKNKINFRYKILKGKILAKFRVNATAFKLKKVKYLGVGVKDIITVTAELPLETK